MSLVEKVQAVVAEKLSVDEAEVLPEASFTDDLNADSLDLVEFEISDEDAESITTVQAAIDYLRDNGVED